MRYVKIMCLTLPALDRATHVGSAARFASISLWLKRVSEPKRTVSEALVTPIFLVISRFPQSITARLRVQFHHALSH